MSNRLAPSPIPPAIPPQRRHTRTHRAAFLSALVLGLAAAGCNCQGESTEPAGSGGSGGSTGPGGSGGGGSNTGVVEPAPASVLLEVTDEAGAPVPLAAIRAQGSVLPADGAGRRLLEGLPAGRFVARVEAPGFASATAVLDLPADGHGGVTVQLAKLGAPVPFDAGAGATFDQGPIHLVLPPGALVDEHGNPVTGAAEATFVALDPLAMAPGPEPGPLDVLLPDGTFASLSGASKVDIAFWQDGHRLQLASGAAATLELVLPDAIAAGHVAGDTLPSYSFDLDAGAWKEEGAGTLQPSAFQPGELAWSGQIGHLSWWTVTEPWWKVDSPPVPLACYAVTVVDGSTGLPVPNVPLKAFVWDYLMVTPLQLSKASGPVYFGIPLGSTGQLYVGAPDPIVPTVWLSGAATKPCKEVIVEIPAVVCTPGSYESCPYTGPAGTEGVGVCAAGRDYCNSTGTGWLGCAGQLVPSAESCDVPFDEDCDGQSNEEGAGCSCVPGSTQPCYDGPAGTQGVGTCKGGTRTCQPSGKEYGPCTGEIVPQAEDCGTPEDESCDGSITCAQASGPPALCSRSIGASVSSWSRGLAVDGAGNVIHAGGLVGTADLGGGPLSAAVQSVLVVKRDGACNHLWSKVYEPAAGGNGVVAESVAVDGAGNTFVTGYFGGTIDFGDGPLTSVGSGFETDIFLLKLDPDGNTLWSKRFGDELGDQYGLGVATDALGNVFLTGNLPGTADFGGGPVPGIGFVVKLDPSGAHLWSKGFSGARGRGIATGAAGNVVLLGTLEGPVDFGGGVLSPTGGDRDLYVVEYDADGGHLWSKAFPATGVISIWGGDVALDPSGDILIASSSFGNMDFGGGDLVGAGGTDIFVAKLTADGQHVWSKRFGDSQPQAAYGIAVDGLGDVFVAGDLAGVVNFGGAVLSSAGMNDVFVAKLGGAGGEPVWAARFGDPAGQRAVDLAVHPAGGLVVTGDFTGTLDLGTGVLTAAGNGDGFLTRFGP